MKRVLVAYATNAGSTAEVAAAVGEELGRGGAHVDLLRMRDVLDLGGYDAVVVGAPMLLGNWLKEAVNFVTDHQQALSQVPVAWFITALHQTKTTATHVDSIPIYQDPALATPSRHPDRLSFTERMATVERYLLPVLRKAPLARPASVGFFAGKLEYRTLSLPKRLFARILIRREGDFRNWPAIRTWAAEVRPHLLADELVQDPAERPRARLVETAAAVALGDAG